MLPRVARCPVCKQVLGKVRPGEIGTLFCEECDTEFTFYPGEGRPSAKIHPHNTYCDCANCRYLREKDNTTRINPPLDYWYDEDQ